jgi:Fe2+ or Zn2+ uptake regulation protein
MVQFLIQTFFPPNRLSDREALTLEIIRRLGLAKPLDIHRELRKVQGREPALAAIYTDLDRLEKKGRIYSHLEKGGPERCGRPVRVCWAAERE